MKELTPRICIESLQKSDSNAEAELKHGSRISLPFRTNTLAVAAPTNGKPENLSPYCMDSTESLQYQWRRAFVCARWHWQKYVGKISF